MGKVGEGFLEKVNLELGFGAYKDFGWVLAGSSLFKCEEDRLDTDILLCNL